MVARVLPRFIPKNTCKVTNEEIFSRLILHYYVLLVYVICWIHVLTPRDKGESFVTSRTVRGFTHSEYINNMANDAVLYSE